MNKKIMALFLAQSLVFGMSGAVFAEAADAADPAQELLEAVAGTYEPLFPVTNQPEYDQLWIDDCAAVVGEEAAEATAEVLKNACYGDIYGEEAIEAYSAEDASPQFKCDFIEGVSQITFDGNTISGVDAD